MRYALQRRLLLAEILVDEISSDTQSSGSSTFKRGKKDNLKQ